MCLIKKFYILLLLELEHLLEKASIVTSTFTHSYILDINDTLLFQLQGQILPYFILRTLVIFLTSKLGLRYIWPCVIFLSSTDCLRSCSGIMSSPEFLACFTQTGRINRWCQCLRISTRCTIKGSSEAEDHRSMSLNRFKGICELWKCAKYCEHGHMCIFHQIFREVSWSAR